MTVPALLPAPTGAVPAGGALPAGPGPADRDPLLGVLAPGPRPGNCPAGAWVPVADGPVNPGRVEVRNPGRMAEHVKEAARYFGAGLVGICSLAPGDLRPGAAAADLTGHTAASPSPSPSRPRPSSVPAAGRGRRPGAGATWTPPRWRCAWPP